MKMSFEGLLFLVGHEGVVQSRYKDSKGVWTIGIGHTASAGGLNPQTFYGKLSLEEVIDLFAKDLAKFEARVNKAFKVKLAQHEFDAAVSFDYNTGAIDTATWVKQFNAGDRAGAIKSIMNWKKPVEIIGRRTAERDLFKTGVYPVKAATVFPATADGRVQWGQGKMVDLKAILDKAIPKDVPLPEPKPQPQPAKTPTSLWAWVKSWFA